MKYTLVLSLLGLSLLAAGCVKQGSPLAEEAPLEVQQPATK